MCNFGRAVSSRLLTSDCDSIGVLYYWYSLFNIPFGLLGWIV